MSNRLNKILFALTILCFASLGYYMIFPRYTLARAEYPWLYFLVGLFFFNTTHIFITYVSVFFLPEFKSLKFLRSGRFLIRCLSIFLVTAGISWLCLENGKDNQILTVLLRVFIFSTTIHHTNMQTFGLSNQLDRNSPANLLEKYSVLGFTFFSVILYLLARIKFQMSTYVLVFVLFALWIAVSVAIVRSTKKNNRVQKSIFLARYVCVYLSFIHPVITLISMTFHGLEYLQTFYQLRGKSKIDVAHGKRSTLWLWIAVPGTALFIHYKTVSMLMPDYRLDENLIIVLESVVLGLNILHFFLDAKLYQFKNREVRENIAPLFEVA